MKRIISFLFGFVACCSLAFTQNAGIKTNLVHWAAAGTPNAGLEFALNRKYTLEVGGGFNWIVQPELRYWLCESFNGHFFGLHALVGNII